MSDPDDTPPGGKENWEGFREVDRAIAENRLTSYTWKKTRPLESRVLRELA